MKTLNLHEAAAFLRMHPEEVRTRAKRGLIPGAKPGKRWVFLEDDLAAFVRSLYAAPRPPLRSKPADQVWACANEETSGGLTSSLPTEREYAELLKPISKQKRKSYTTS